MVWRCGELNVRLSEWNDSISLWLRSERSKDVPSIFRCIELFASRSLVTVSFLLLQLWPLHPLPTSSRARSDPLASTRCWWTISGSVSRLCSLEKRGMNVSRNKMEYMHEFYWHLNYHSCCCFFLVILSCWTSNRCCLESIKSTSDCAKCNSQTSYKNQ